MSGHFLNWTSVLLAFLLEAIIVVLLFRTLRNIRRLRRKNFTLRQEQEVVFEFVHSIGEVFADAEEVDMDSLLKRILFFATKTGKAASGCLYLFDHARAKLYARAVAGVFPPLWSDSTLPVEQTLAKSQYLEQVVRTHPVPVGEGLIGSAASVGSGIIIPDAEIDARVPTYEADFLKIRSLLIVPMRFGNEALGVLALVNRTDERPFGSGDLNLIQAMADQASVPIHYAGLKADLEHKRQIDRDLQAAQQIQSSLLPQQVPQIEGVELAAFNLPAFDIGGDYYDFIPIDDEHLGIVIADVAGKGIGGAMMMAVCQGVLRTRAQQEQSPAHMLAELNRVLSANLAEDMFITMLYMVLNIRTRELKFARAGHERPLLNRAANGRPEPLNAAGIAIGLADAAVFEAAIKDVSLQLEPGDAVMIYTDGITEALNEEGHEWGFENLSNTFSEASPAGSEAIIEQIHEKIVRFVGARQQYDDMTLLALEVH